MVWGKGKFCLSSLRRLLIGDREADKADRRKDPRPKKGGDFGGDKQFLAISIRDSVLRWTIGR